MNGRLKSAIGGVRRRRGAALRIAALLALAAPPAADAVPRRIIMLRHGEKQDQYRLCSVGQQRSLALRARYLGKGAADSLFHGGAGPAGIFAVTLHTLELASPAAQSWSLPIQLYSVAPADAMPEKEETLLLNRRTREAAHDVLADPRWDGATVVIVWEHHHIADRRLEGQFPGEKVTLRQLLNLDRLPEVPKDWPGSNYDYFWIVEYADAGSAIPTGFALLKQKFPAPFQALPSNDWGAPDNLPRDIGCLP